MTTPIYQTSTYLQDDIGDLRQGTNIHVLQILRASLESVIANLEHGKHGLLLVQEWQQLVQLSCY